MHLFRAGLHMDMVPADSGIKNRFNFTDGFSPSSLCTRFYRVELVVVSGLGGAYGEWVSARTVG